MSWPDSFLEEALQSAEEQDRFRRLRSISRREGRHFEWLGQRYVNFSSNDYLGLSQCQSIKNISAKAVEEWGVGSTASRLVAGNLSLHEQLEQALCQWKGAEAALVFNSGYQANLGIMQALLGAKDQVFADRFIHASLIDGIKLSQARLRRYRHNDYQHLEKLLRENTKKSVRSVIVSESVFSMDGDFGDLDELCRLAEE